ncbi:MAG: NUDIX domain-containing protein [Candidatus Nanoarchaeia archaeon]
MFKYPRIAVDVIALAKHKTYHILLIKRKNAPWKGKWALPGGFVDKYETLEKAAKRELKEETGITINKLHKLKPFDTPKRDPRGQVISIPHVGTTRYQLPKGNDDAAEAKWVPISKIPILACDHNKIATTALQFARKSLLKWTTK